MRWMSTSDRGSGDGERIPETRAQEPLSACPRLPEQRIKKKKTSPTSTAQEPPQDHAKCQPVLRAQVYGTSTTLGTRVTWDISEKISAEGGCVSCTNYTSNGKTESGGQMASTFQIGRAHV